MLLDVRIYRCKPGMIQRHLDLYEAEGKPPQFRLLGDPLFYGRVETPDQNEYVHIWVYENAADRMAKRAAMAADPEWQAYAAKSAALGALDSQFNRLVTSVPFDPLAAARGG